MNDFVSVVMPVYNSAKYVFESITSVLNQSYKNIELIIINDGSTDDSDYIIKKFRTEPKIKYIYQDNKGPSATRNCGILSSKGNYIAFLDSDDVWLEDKLERQLQKIKQDGADIIYSDRFNIDIDGNIISRKKPLFYSGNIIEALYIDNFICLSSSLLRKDVFKKVGLFNESLHMSEDYEFWLRAALQCTFCFVDEALVKYRIHPNQSSARYIERLEAISQIYKLIDPILRNKINSKTLNKSKALHYCNWGYYHSSSGNKTDAIKMYLKALKHTPHNLKIIKSIIGCLYEQ